ncbi:flavodoxin [Lacrimispora brassicae]
MKKIINLLSGITLILALTACGTSGAEAGKDKDAASKEQAANSLQTQQTDMGKALVVYFSMPETTNPNNMTKAEADSTVIVDGKVLGNTQYAATVIQENTGADMFPIEPKTPYPTDHGTLVEQAEKEKENKLRPEIKNRIEDISQYDTIFLGYPTWWSDMPMILYSFLDEYDLSGKTIIPFNTHGGSGFANTIDTISELEPDATVNKNGFTVSRDNVQEAENDIIVWLSGLKE